MIPPAPTPRLLALSLGGAALLLLGTSSSAALLFVPIYLVGVAITAGLDLFAGPRIDQFSVNRNFEPRLSIGANNRVDLSVHWHGGTNRAMRIWVRDEPPPEIAGTSPLFLDSVASGDSWSGRYNLSPVRRGDYLFGRLHLRAETPLGLFRRQFSFDLEAPVKVYPDLREVQRHRLLVRQGRIREAGIHLVRHRGGGTDFRQLRDYQPDDDFRRIAWKATARRGVPTTIDYETERAQNIIIALDTGRLMGATVGPLEKLDHAINAALLLTQIAVEMGDRPGLLVFADTVRSYLPPRPGPAQFSRILEQLYALDVQPVEPDHAQVLRTIARKESRRAMIVLFTDHADITDADRLGAEFGLLARRHLPVYVTLRDPDIESLSAAVPDNSRAFSEKIVARRLLDERRLLLDRLERSGVQVLDTTAEQLNPSLINRYVEIKLRGRL